MQVAESANSGLFKDFCSEAEMEKNSQIGVLYLIIVPNHRFHHQFLNFGC